MKLLLIRSIPISAETKEAWKANGALFMRRTRQLETVAKLPFDVILNLGDSSFDLMDDLTMKWWNLGKNIRMFRSPIAMRENFGDLIPPRPELEETEWWHKTSGRGGSGNTFSDGTVFGDIKSNLAGDFQTHINGAEYRVVTVGKAIVQQHRREGTDRNRSYEWLPAENLPRGVRPLVKKAVKRIPGNNVIAWDVIVNEAPYILEGNASPGVNTATAFRIITEINRQREDANANPRVS